MAGLFGSITIKGNRLTDFAAQTATVGIPIPFGFGKFPCEGNVIFAPMPPKEHVKKKKQGKGGVKTEEYSYTLSYAIAFCEGPIFGFWTIKRNGKIVWTQAPDASVDDLAYAAKWAAKATFYYGTSTQLPDSTIESYKGAGNVSAFRDLAYIVVEDDDVTDNGGAVPTYEAICIGIGTAYATSPPYVVDYQEDLAISPQLEQMELRDIYHEGFSEENISLLPSLPSIMLRSLRKDLYPETEHLALAPSLPSITLRRTLTALDAPTEHVSLAPSLVSIKLKDSLISATTSTEHIALTPSLPGVSLYVP